MTGLADWSWVAGSARSLWVGFDAFVAAIAIPLILFSFWWMVFSGLLWVVLGFAALVCDRASRRLAVRESDLPQPETTRYGIRAMRVAFAVVALLCLAPALSVVAGKGAVWVFVGGALAFDVLSLMLHREFIRLNLDLLRHRRVLGAKAVAAYATVTVGMWSAVWTGFWVATLVGSLLYVPPA